MELNVLNICSRIDYFFNYAFYILYLHYTSVQFPVMDGHPSSILKPTDLDERVNKL